MSAARRIGIPSASVLAAVLLGAACAPAPEPPAPADAAAASHVVMLRDGDFPEREAAALALARDPDPAAVPALAQAARTDHQSRVRIAAVRALAAHDHPLVEPTLIALAEDRHEQVRLAVCQVLGAQGSPEAAQALVRRLDDDRSPSVRFSALAALGGMGEVAAPILRDRFEAADPAGQRMILRALAREPRPEHADLFLAALGADHGEARSTAAEALARIGDTRAIPRLAALIREPMGDADTATFDQRLEQRPTSRDLQDIEKLLDEDLRRRGAGGRPNQHGWLYRSPDAPLQQFRRLVGIQRGEFAQATREAAALALLRLDAPEAMDTLADLLADEDRDVAAAARHAFGRLDDDQVDRLHRLVRDAGSPASARIRALDLLIARAEAREQAAGPGWGQTLAAALGAAVETHDRQDGLPARLRDDLAALLDDRDAAVRLHAANLLAARGDPEAGPALTRFLRDGDEATRIRAIDAVGALRHAPAVPALIELAGRGATNQRRRAIQALGTIGDPAAVDALLPLIREEGDLRVPAIQALGQIGHERAAGPLLDLFTSLEPRASPYHDTMRALGQVGARDAVPALIGVVNAYGHFVDVREAISALGLIGDSAAVGPISEALLKRPLRLRHGADQVADAHGIPALVRLGGPRAIDTLRRMGARRGPEYSPSTAIAAIRALGGIEDRRAAEALVSLLADPEIDISVKETAVAPALMQSGDRAVGSLRRLLRDAPALDDEGASDPGVHAAELLAYIGGEGLAALLAETGRDIPRHVLGRVIEGLGRSDEPEAVAALGRLIGHDDAEVRQWAVVALGRGGAPGSEALLREASKSDDADVRTWAEWGLERRTDRAQAPVPEPQEATP